MLVFFEAEIVISGIMASRTGQPMKEGALSCDDAVFMPSYMCRVDENNYFG